MGKRKLWIWAAVVFFAAASLLSDSKRPGKLDLEELMSGLPGFQDQFDSYQPQKSAIQELQSGSEFVRIKVFFRFNCSTSQELVPAFIKIMDSVDNPYYESDYISLTDDKSQWESDSGEYTIAETPTFILFKDNEELGRIVENPLDSLEQDLVEILQAPPPSDYSLDYDFFMNNYHADLDVNCSECHLPY
jgi:hypothetical protein